MLGPFKGSRVNFRSDLCQSDVSWDANLGVWICVAPLDLSALSQKRAHMPEDDSLELGVP